MRRLGTCTLWTVSRRQALDSTRPPRSVAREQLAQICYRFFLDLDLRTEVTSDLFEFFNNISSPGSMTSVVLNTFIEVSDQKHKYVCETPTPWKSESVSPTNQRTDRARGVGSGDAYESKRTCNF